MNRKGIAEQIMIILILIVVLAVLMFFFWAWSVIAPTTTNIIKDVNNNLIGAGDESGDGNLSNAISVPLNAVNQTFNALPWITYLVLFGVLFGFLALCFYVRTYPFLIFFWIVGIGVVVFMSFWLTSAYQDYTSDGSYVASAATGWTTNHFIMSNLPMIFTAIGILGGIIMFVLISKEPEAEALPI